jgi:hypothetical protein
LQKQTALRRFINNTLHISINAKAIATSSASEKGPDPVLMKPWTSTRLKRCSLVAMVGTAVLYNRISLIPQTSTTRPPHVGIWGSSWNQMSPPQIPPVSGIWWNQMIPPPDPTRSHQIPPDPTISHHIPPISCAFKF